MNTALADYVVGVEDLPEEAFLGSIVMMSVHNLRGSPDIPNARATMPGHTGVTRDQLEGWFDKLGLDKRHLRPEIKPAKAFANATGRETRCTYSVPMETQLTWVDVSGRSDRERMTRHLVRTVTDRKAREAHVDTRVAELIFFKEAEALKVNIIEDALTPTEVQIVTDFVNATAQRFQDLAKFYTNAAIRWSVREQTKDLNALMLSAGGTYFIHRKRSDTVDALRALLDRLPEGSSYHTIPLLDDGYQREQLTNALEAQLEEWAESLDRKISGAWETVNSDGALKPHQFTRIQDDVKDAIAKAEEHTALLDRAATTGAQALERALLSVGELTNHVDWA